MTEGVIAAVITGLFAVVVVLLGVLLRRVNQVHALANSRLTQALNEIGELKTLLGVERGEAAGRAAERKESE